MNISELYSSGLFEKGEEVSYFSKATLVIPGLDKLHGFLVFTNRRFLFLRKPHRFHSKGLDIFRFFSWNDVLSVSTSGLISKRVNVHANMGNTIVRHRFACEDVEEVARKLVESKNNYVKANTIEATKVIIAEANKNNDDATVILQKRLARGEITLEEFHRLVTRT